MSLSDNSTKNVMAVAVVAMGAVVATGVWFAIAEKRAFMDECQQHKLRFECVALWKSVQPDTVTIYRND